MSVADLITRGFHLRPRESFLATPACLLGRVGVPAGLAIPPLWSLRFSASTVFGEGCPDGSSPPSAFVRQRLQECVRDELVVSLALRVTADRNAYKRTPCLPVDVINRVLAYDGPDDEPTRAGIISIHEVGARLCKAHTLPTEKLVEVHPLHVSEPLQYMPDEAFEVEEPADVVMEPQVPVEKPTPSVVTIQAPPVNQTQEDRAAVPGDSVVGPEPLARVENAPRSAASRLVAPSGEPSPSRVPRLPVPSLVANSTEEPPSSLAFDFPAQAELVPESSAEMGTRRVDMAEFRGAYPYLREASAPLKNKPATTLREVLECVSGWVRRVDPYSRKPSKRGSRGGTARDLRRARQEVTSSRQDNACLRQELGAMTDRVSRLSEKVVSQAEVIPGKRQRVDHEGARSSYARPWSDADNFEGKAYRFYRGRSPREKWYVCREPDPWRRHNPEGDGGAGFAT